MTILGGGGMQDLWFQRNTLMVMSYLSLHQGGEPVHGRKLAEELKLSQSSVSTILRKMETNGVVTARQAGKTLGFRAAAGHPLLKAFRVFENQLMLQTLVHSIRNECRQIILFGSCAKGEDFFDSDIDLFVLGDEPDTIREMIAAARLERELNLVLVNPMELTMMETSDRAFLMEIRKGIVLWEQER